MSVNRAYFNRRSSENEYGCSEKSRSRPAVGRVYTKIELLYNEYG